MTTIAPETERIAAALAELFSHELQSADTIARLSEVAAGNGMVRDLLGEVAATARAHSASVAARHKELTGSAPQSTGEAQDRSQHATPSAALQQGFEVLSGLVIRYAALLPVANRFRDSPITAPSGTTSHLVRDHIQSHITYMGRIAGLIQHAVLAELTAEGFECRCTCPACGIGLCVCGIGARSVLSEAWVAARPEPASGTVVLSHPRKSSAAAAAGIENGDLLEEIGSAPLETFVQLQTTLKSHEIGSTVKLGIRRGMKPITMQVVRTPDIGEGTLPLDCEVPSGQVFYLDRARDLQQRLRRRNGKERVGSGVASLSAREILVLRILADGATNPMIAEKLGISRPTVARHVANILVKLNATNRSEATAIAIAAGFGAEP
jgi:DNA-binding CsgD family transcriptional regulator